MCLGDRVPFRRCVGRCVLANVSLFWGERGVADVSCSSRVLGDRVSFGGGVGRWVLVSPCGW